MLLFIQLPLSLSCVLLPLLLEPLLPCLFHVVQLLLRLVHLISYVFSISESKVCPVDVSSFSRGISEYLCELVVLCPQFSDNFVLDALIDDCFVHNLLCSICVSKS